MIDSNNKDIVIIVCLDCGCFFSNNTIVFCPGCGGVNNEPVSDDLPF